MACNRPCLAFGNPVIACPTCHNDVMWLGEMELYRAGHRDIHGLRVPKGVFRTLSEALQAILDLPGYYYRTQLGYFLVLGMEPT